jgi:lysophospholipase L1-like esterase
LCFGVSRLHKAFFLLFLVMIKNVLSLVFIICLGVFSCSKKKEAPPLPKIPNLINQNTVIGHLKAGVHIKIACEGTSLTYGEDYAGTDTTFSTLPNGPTRAKNQYPSSMLNALNNAQFTLSIRGYPGDRTTDALARWKDSTQTDICIIEYGTNDAYNFGGYASGSVSVATFGVQFRQLVKRRVDQGAWVIVCLPPYLESGDKTITAYRDTAKVVAAAFSTPVFDVEQSISTIPAAYSDGVHLNAVGYEKWGVDIAAFITGLIGKK